MRSAPSSSSFSSSSGTGASSTGTPWGNLVFTATLLLATIWHAEEVNWRFLVAHLWVILHTLEPVTMFFLIPRGAAATGEPLRTGGPLGTWLRRLLIFEVAALGLFGLFLFINPTWLTFAGHGRSPSSTRESLLPGSWGRAVRSGPGRLRWPPIGTRYAGVSSLTSSSGPRFAPQSSSSGRNSISRAMPTLAYAAGMVVLTLGLGFLYWRQEKGASGG